MANIRARTDLTLTISGSESILYGPDGQQIHVLNRTALFIWENLDGHNSVDDIEHLMHKQFMISESVDVRRDIETTIELFADLNLIQSDEL